LIQTFDFSEALRLLKRGYRVARVGWPQGFWIELKGETFFEHGIAELSPFAAECVLAEDWHLA
jgi:hypothetical protein